MGEAVLLVLKKEEKRLNKNLEKTKAEYEEYMNVGKELIAINREFLEIAKSKDFSAEALDKLKLLQAREKKAKRIMKKDSLKMLDRQHEVTFALSDIRSEIARIEWRNGK